MSLAKLSPTRWEYAEHETTDWSACSQFPTEIHLELRAAGKIPDWNKGRAEHDVQWVAKKSWAFRTTIEVSPEQLKAEKAELEFEGLDTFATVHLNGKVVLETDNHFRTWCVQVNDLQPSNEILIVFRPPQEEALKVAAEHGPFRGGSCNLGDRSRIGIRKSQYHARWDWGPELWCMGPDRPVHLNLFTSRLKSIQAAARVDENLKTSLVVSADIQGPAKDWQVSLDGKVLGTGQSGDKVEYDVDAKLWWPVNEGSQTRYTVQVDLLSSDGSVLDTITQKIGFRRTELIQDPLNEGTSFYFKINGRPIFCAGSNWIPIDMILPSGTPERYRKWLNYMVQGNQNMIRIWGGGVFEPDVFYDLCDELGVMVWQDFMFACGVYPVFPKFLESVTAEAEDNVMRLRHHPSLVIYCGNNEDYQQILQWDFESKDDPLPARVIYEKILPDIVSRLVDPPVPYWFGSPYGGKGWDTADPTVGDVHQWNVWAGKELSYHDWDIMGGRFISEFGMPGMPDRRTVDYWLDGDMTQAYPGSKLMQQHNKAGSHERRFAIAMNDNFRLTGDLEEYSFRNRLMQSEAVGSAYATWRRQWKGPGKEFCAGVLVWQLNDCWPVTSWALIDYFYRPKPVYYAIKRASAPVALGIRREVTKNRENDRPRQFYEYGAFQSREVKVEIWAGNATQTERQVKLSISAVDLATDWTYTAPEVNVTLPANMSTELWSGSCPQPTKGFDKAARSGTVVLHAILRSKTGQVISRFSDWPLPYRLYGFPDPELRIEVDGDNVTVSVNKPAKGVWLDTDGDDVLEWSDNNLDIYPGDPQAVIVKGLNGRKVHGVCLGHEK